MTFSTGPYGYTLSIYTLKPGPPDVSLQKNASGQNITFTLVNSANGQAVTNASSVNIFVSKDGGAQTTGGGTVTNLGNGQYNYGPTQLETNGSCVSFFITSSVGLPTNMMFLTSGGLHKNVANQHVTFSMMGTNGAPDTGASVSVFAVKDSGNQAAGTGTVTNLGNGQYDYSPTASETNGVECSFLFTASGDIPYNINLFTIVP